MPRLPPEAIEKIDKYEKLARSAIIAGDLETFEQEYGRKLKTLVRMANKAKYPHRRFLWHFAYAFIKQLERRVEVFQSLMETYDKGLPMPPVQEEDQRGGKEQGAAASSEGPARQGLTMNVATPAALVRDPGGTSVSACERYQADVSKVRVRVRTLPGPNGIPRKRAVRQQGRVLVVCSSLVAQLRAKLTSAKSKGLSAVLLLALTSPWGWKNLHRAGRRATT